MLILVAFALPVVATLLVSVLAALYGDRLRPGAAVTTLTVAAVGTAVASVIAVAVLAFAGMDQLPVPRRMAYWLDDHGPLDRPLPEAVGVLALVALALMATSVLYRTVLITVAFVRSDRNWGRSPAPNGLVIVDTPIPDAFAVAGPRQRIVISRSLLRALPHDQRRALIAHERAHLDSHHQFFIQAVDVAAAANPLLLPVTRQIRAYAERWADESAAARVGRPLIARALTTAALARTAAQRSTRSPQNPLRPVSGALSAIRHGVVERVLALKRPAPRPRPTFSVVLIAMTVAALLTALVLVDSFEDSSEHAGPAAQVRISHER